MNKYFLKNIFLFLSILQGEYLGLYGSSYTPSKPGFPSWLSRCLCTKIVLENERASEFETMVSLIKEMILEQEKKNQKFLIEESVEEEVRLTEALGVIEEELVTDEEKLRFFFTDEEELRSFLEAKKYRAEYDCQLLQLGNMKYYEIKNNKNHVLFRQLDALFALPSKFKVISGNGRVRGSNLISYVRPLDAEDGPSAATVSSDAVSQNISTSSIQESINLSPPFSPQLTKAQKKKFKQRFKDLFQKKEKSIDGDIEQEDENKDDAQGDLENQEDGQETGSGTTFRERFFVHWLLKVMVGCCAAKGTYHFVKYFKETKDRALAQRIQEIQMRYVALAAMEKDPKKAALLVEQREAELASAQRFYNAYCPTLFDLIPISGLAVCWGFFYNL